MGVHRRHILVHRTSLAVSRCNRNAAAFHSGEENGRRLLDLDQGNARFVDNRGKVTETYPYNPNGSPQGIASATTPDGRFTILMPHPERVFRSVLFSWHPDGWGEDSPWMRIFQNARAWVG